ncbi:hypothetical protein ACMFMG_006704 [Clarireedia jacksonii]
MESGNMHFFDALNPDSKPVGGVRQTGTGSSFWIWGKPPHERRHIGNSNGGVCGHCTATNRKNASSDHAHKGHEYISTILICRETMPTSEPLIYAELLPNIRQISIVAELDTSSNATTKVKLAAEGRQIVLQHNGKDTALPLPGQIAPQVQIQELPTSRKDLTYRLPLAGAFRRADVDDAQSITAPWSARDLIPGAQFTCRKCNSGVIETGSIKEWRDLPSENWAEMMDFWHCHKPSDHGHSHANGEHTDLESTKGYGANSMFTAQTGIGFVDLTSFLVMESDCLSVSKDDAAICKSCKATLGFPDPQKQGVRLLKWTLQYQESPTPPSITPTSASHPPMSLIISAQILAIMSSQCVSRLVLSPKIPNPTATSLSIWVLSPSLRYTSSLHDSDPSALVSPRSKTGILAMKILWEPVNSARAQELTNNESVEELLLPEEAIYELKGILDESAKYLPSSARKLQAWNLGLLERDEPHG